jgi:hypothetical protein
MFLQFVVGPWVYCTAQYVSITVIGESGYNLLDANWMIGELQQAPSKLVWSALLMNRL